MAVLTSKLDTRLKVEGKDAINRFVQQRRDFIKDVCIEVSSSQRYNWLEETVELVVPATITDWITLPADFHEDCDVYVDGQPFEYISERDYATDQFKVTTTVPYGYYRIRYEASSGRFQISLVNGPVAGTTVKVLYRKYLTAPEQFPDFMEEILVKGALSRFLMFQEGDDVEVATDARQEYIRLAQQQDKLGNNKLSAKPRRTKTNRELMDSEMYNRYGR